MCCCLQWVVVYSRVVPVTPFPGCCCCPACRRTLIQADVVEELLVSAAIHHLELDPALKMMGEEGGSNVPHLQKLFQGISALLRRLQVC